MADLPLVARPRPWRLRFTLRLLLAAVTTLCIWLAIHTQRAREQRRIVDAIQKKWGIVTYDFEEGQSPKARGVQSPVPKWLLDRLGKDFFHSVVRAHVRGDVDLAKVSRLNSIRELIIWKYDLTDDHMQYVGQMRGLRRLVIQSDMHASLPGDYPDTTQIGDRTLSIVAHLPRLESVYLDGYHFTGQGLAALAQSTSLKDVDIRCCDATVVAADVEPLRKLGRIAKCGVRRWTEGKGTEVVAEW